MSQSQVDKWVEACKGSLPKEEKKSSHNEVSHLQEVVNRATPQTFIDNLVKAVSNSSK